MFSILQARTAAACSSRRRIASSYVISPSVSSVDEAVEAAALAGAAAGTGVGAGDGSELGVGDAGAGEAAGELLVGERLTAAG